MPPKNQIRIIILLLFCPIAALAQIGSAQSQVNIIISQAQSIEVLQPSVNISMTQASHYLNGSSSGVQSNHVQVTSTTGYQLNVRSLTQFFSLNGSTTTLPVNSIAVQTTVGSDLTNTGTAAPAGLQVVSQVPLSATAATIATSPIGEGGRGFNVNYTIPANQTQNYLNKAAGTYSTTVVYTLLPQ